LSAETLKWLNQKSTSCSWSCRRLSVARMSRAATSSAPTCRGSWNGSTTRRSSARNASGLLPSIEIPFASATFFARG
jgi:hypothetical protein